MATKVKITYTAPVAPADDTSSQICATFVPTNAAADLPAFDGTYYDTNVWGFGEVESLKQYMDKMVAHPGFIAALRAAVKNGTFESTSENEHTELLIREVAPALKDQGFTFEVNGKAVA